MWIIVRDSILPYLHPTLIIHLAGGYSRVMVSPLEAQKWGQS